MSRKVKPFTHSEYDRLKIRAEKFLSFAFSGKKKPSAKVLESLTIMLAGEYQRGHEAKNGRHYLQPKPEELTRLQHLKKAVLR